MQRVMVFGTFDLLHLGHVDFLKQAKMLGDELIVVVSRDSNASSVKQRETVFTEEERKSMLEQLHLPDCVVLGHHDDVYKIIEEHAPSIIALGYDQQAFTDMLDDELSKRGLGHIQIVRLEADQPDRYKSSHIRERLGL